MRKTIAIMLLVAMVLIPVGCSSNISADVNLPEVNKSTSDIVVTPEEPSPDRTWIYPGKIEINKFFPGARAEQVITIHNGKLEPATFALNYILPEYVAKGYAAAPENFGDWLYIEDMNPTLQGRETRNILVILEIPGDVMVQPQIPEKWEFWITCREVEQFGMVKVAMATRWFVIMKKT